MSNLNESYSIDWFETSLKMNFSHFCYQINLHCLEGSPNQKFFLNYLLKIQIITYFQSRLFVCAFVLSINSQLNSKVKNRTCFGGGFFPDGSLVGSNVLCTSELKSWLKIGIAILYYAGFFCACVILQKRKKYRHNSNNLTMSINSLLIVIFNYSNFDKSFLQKKNILLSC